MAHRIREVLAAEPDLTEKSMFGGLAFLLAGHVVVTASRRGGVMLRVDPARAGRLLTHPRGRRGGVRGGGGGGGVRGDNDARGGAGGLGGRGGPGGAHR